MYEDDLDAEVLWHFNVKYSTEKCVLCGSRIDEFGYCAAGAPDPRPR